MDTLGPTSFAIMDSGVLLFGVFLREVPYTSVQVTQFIKSDD